jgi:PAS domain S-box-containing protein
MTSYTLEVLAAQIDQFIATTPGLENNRLWMQMHDRFKHLGQELHLQKALLETTTSIFNAASSVSDIEQLLILSVEAIKDNFDLCDAAIYLLDPARTWLELKVHVGKSGGRSQSSKPEGFNVDHNSPVGWTVRHKRLHISLDVKHKVQQLTIPLIHKGEAIGALKIQTTEPILYDETTGSFLALGEQLAGAIHNLASLASQTAIMGENSRLLSQIENQRRFLKTVIDHIPDPIFIKNKNHVWIEMNQANANVIGKPAQEMTGHTDQHYFSPELANEFYRRDDEVFRTNKIFQYEDRTVWADGREHIAYTRLIPIPGSTGQAEYLLGITHDITERKAYETERERFLSETAALYNVSRTIAGALSERQVFEAVFEQIQQEDPCEISVFRFNTVQDRPLWAVLKANWQKQNHHTYPMGTRFYLPETPQARLLTYHEPLFIENIATDPRLSDAEREGFIPTGAHSMAILPLAATGQELGLVIISFTKPYSFSEVIKRFWIAIIDQAGVALSNRQLIQAAAYRVVQMETAAEVARAASLLNLGELLNAAVALIRDRFHLYYTGIFLVDENEEWAELKAGTGEAGRTQVEQGHKLKIGGNSMIGWCIQHRRPRIALDVGEDAVRFKNPHLPDTRSEMALPLIHRNKAIGALTVQSEEQAAFSREDVIFLQILADQLTNAIENAKLYEQAQKEISERKRAEQELRSSERKYRELVENANSIIFRMNTQGCVTFFNTFAQEFFGYSEEDILGRNVVGTIVPETATTGQNLQAMIAGILHNPEDYARNENENIRRNGERVWVSWTNKAIFDDHKTMVEILCIGHDVSERRRAEAEREKALERTEAMYRIGQTMATSVDLQSMARLVLGEYLRLLRLKWGMLSLVNKAKVQEIQALCIDGELVESDMMIPTDIPLFQHLIKNPAPLAVGDVYSNPLVKDNQQVRSQLKAKSMLYIPVVLRGEVMGILTAGATEKDHPFSASDIEVGQVITDQLAIWLENRLLLAEAQYRSDRLQTAAEVSRAASSILDVDGLITTSVNLIRDQFDFYYVGLFLVDEACEWAVLRAGTGEAGRLQLEQGHKLKIGGESMIGWSIQNRKARIALDVGQDAVRFKNPALPDTHSEMALPLISREEVIGALTVQSVEPGAFSDEDITMLQTMADQLANAIANARLIERAAQARTEAETRLQETLALQQLSQALSSTLRVDEILSIFFEACIKEIGFEFVQFCLVDKYQNRVKAVAGVGVSESNIKRANRALDSRDILADIVRTGKTELITGWDDRFDRDTFEAEGHADWVRIFTPVTFQQQNIGVVEAGFNKNTYQSFEETQVRLLKAFINQTALALDNAQRYEASQRRARREALIKEITTRVRASTDLQTILQTTVKEVGDAIGSKCAYIHLSSAQRANSDKKKPGVKREYERE